MKKNKFEQLARTKELEEKKKEELRGLAKKVLDKFPEFTPEELKILFPGVFL